MDGGVDSVDVASPAELPDSGAGTVPSMSSSLGNAIVLVLVASLPVVLTGAMSTEMRSDIGFRDSDLGLAVTGYYIAAATLSVAGGRLSERWGLSWSARLAAVLATSGCCVVAAADGLAMLFPALLLGGASIALAQPAANALVVRQVPFARRGLAFGIKQSAIPGATALAGIAVPTVALTVGWRWAFVAAGLIAAVVAVVVPRNVARSGAVSDPQMGKLTGSVAKLAGLAVASALAAAPALSLPVFLTSSALRRGISPGHAGVLLAVASVIGLVARLLAGARADRRLGDQLGPIAVLMAIGAVGLLGMTARHSLLFTGATILAFAAGRAWQGLFNHAVTSRWHAMPAAVTGITQTGAYTGGIIGPLAFGTITTRWSDRLGWAALGAMMAMATLLVLLLRPHMDPSSAQ